MRALAFVGFVVTGLLAISKVVGIALVLNSEASDSDFLVKQSVYAACFAAIAAALWRRWRGGSAR